MHCLVTGGGRTADGSWQAVRQGFLLPVRGGMAVVRGKRLAARRQALACEALRRPEGSRPQQRLPLLRRFGPPRQTKGTVHIRERDRPGAGVGPALGRSRRGGPSKHARLVAGDGARVTCTCRAR
jgi:hypothetical protein